jgi:hypothetical protein
LLLLLVLLLRTAFDERRATMACCNAIDNLMINEVSDGIGSSQLYCCVSSERIDK